MTWLALLVALVALAGVVYLLFVEGELARFDRRADTRALGREQLSQSQRLSDVEDRLAEIERVMGSALGIGGR